MNIQDFNAIGSYLYGERWKSAISTVLTIAESTVRSICIGRRRISEKVEREVYKIVAERQAAEILPVLNSVKNTGKLPQPIILQPEKRTWTKEADEGIKEELVKILTKHGIESLVKG